MSISLSFHIVGLVFWAGGLIFLTRILKGLSEAMHVPTAVLLKRCYFGFVIPGLVMGTASGIYQLLYKGLNFYFKETHWFHAKATLLIVLYVVTALVGTEIAKAAKGEIPSRGKVGALHGLSSGLVVLIVFLTLISAR